MVESGDVDPDLYHHLVVESSLRYHFHYFITTHPFTFWAKMSMLDQNIRT